MLTLQRTVQILRYVMTNAKKIIILIEGIKAIRELINESDGVAGLHLNGDIALWSELEQGGQYAEWLYDFNDAEELIRMNKNDR